MGVPANFSDAADLTTSSARPIKRILIANRGEIALRVTQAAQILGIETVGIYTAPDRHSPHVHHVDQAVELAVARGRSPVSAHLDIEQIIRIAKETGADAIHPGYGFLAEDPEFA